MLCCGCFVQALGWALLVKVLYDVVMGVYAKFLRPGKDLKKYGKWALVTGATDGIGKAYAFALAKQGLNVVIVSRTASKLDEVKKEIVEKYPKVEVKVVAADMGNISEAARKELAEACASNEIGVLINNVGVSYPYPKYYHELDDAQAETMVSLNVTSTNVMTRLVLPGMLERKKGAVVNVSSFSGVMPSPLLSAYSGVKCGVTMQTAGLAIEYAPKGIDFQAQVPLFVSTKLAKQRPSLTVPTPDAYVRAALKTIGHDTVVSPYWAHALITYVITKLPAVIVNPQVVKMHLGLRKRGMAKDAKNQ